jgi:hypothetical protein
MRCQLLSSLVVVLALVSVGIAGAEDFTLRVPVVLHRIPSAITTVAITAAVYDATWDQEHPTVGEHRVGYGNSAGVTIRDGEFSDTVTVSFNASTQLRRRPEEAVFYQVVLLLYGPTNGYSGGCLAAMDPNGPYPCDPSQPIVCRYIGRLDEPPAPKRVEKRLPLFVPRIKR